MASTTTKVKLISKSKPPTQARPTKSGMTLDNLVGIAVAFVSLMIGLTTYFTYAVELIPTRNPIASREKRSGNAVVSRQSVILILLPTDLVRWWWWWWWWWWWCNCSLVILDPVSDAFLSPSCPLYQASTTDGDKDDSMFDISSWRVPHQMMHLACSGGRTKSANELPYAPAILTPEILDKAALLVHQCIGQGKSAWIQGAINLPIDAPSSNLDNRERQQQLQQEDKQLPMVLTSSSLDGKVDFVHQRHNHSNDLLFFDHLSRVPWPRQDTSHNVHAGVIPCLVPT